MIANIEYFTRYAMQDGACRPGGYLTAGATTPFFDSILLKYLSTLLFY